MLSWIPVIGFYVFLMVISFVRWDRRGITTKAGVVYSTATVAFICAVYEAVVAARHSPQVAVMMMPLVLLPGAFVAVYIIRGVKRIVPLIVRWYKNR